MPTKSFPNFLANLPVPPPQAAPLTVADLLKRETRDAWIECNGYLLQWSNGGEAWQIYSEFRSRPVFANPDESAAVAEFLRLTEAL